MSCYYGEIANKGRVFRNRFNILNFLTQANDTLKTLAYHQTNARDDIAMTVCLGSSKKSSINSGFDTRAAGTIRPQIIYLNSNEATYKSFFSCI